MKDLDQPTLILENYLKLMSDTAVGFEESAPFKIVLK